MPGATVALEFALANSHPVETATGIAFTDNLDAVVPGLVAVGLPATVCGGTIDGTNSLSFSGGSLGPSSDCTFTVTLQVPGDADAASSFANVTSAMSATMSPSDVAVSGAAATDDLHVAFFSFTKAFAWPAIAGGTATLTYTIDNLDTAQPGSNIAFVDDLDSMLLGAAATGLPVSGVCGPGSELDGTSTLTLRGASLRAGGTCSFSVGVLVPGGAAVGTYSNTTGPLTAGGFVIAEPASATLTVEPTPAFSKQFVPPLEGLGEPATLTFTIDNSASAMPATLDFTDNLPAGMAIHSVATPASCTGGTLTAVVGADVLSYAGGVVGAGATCAVHVEVVTAALGDFVNTSEPLVANGVTTALIATDTLTVVPQPVFAKAFAPSSISVGESSTLTFTIDNTGSTLAVTDLAFTDTLPAGVVVANPASESATCVGGTLTATAGGDTIAYMGGALDPGAACEVAVNVTSNTAGVFANTSGDLTSNAGNSGAATASLTVEELQRPSTPPDEGCGCSSHRGPGAWWLGWLAIAMLRRVRRCPTSRSRRLGLR
jgi:uncharacterized repeat protein (TIGR01451 family)/MYXO-CTERM domain-containing protein